jgi:CubicO group peptidase (beta-lactamase class C family)
VTVNQGPASGFSAPRFWAVRDAFTEILTANPGLGASLGVYVGGQRRVSLRGGRADPVTGRPWDAGTVSVIFSATKGAVAVLAWLLAERGMLDFDAPVTAYWPEFGEGGKSAVRVRDVFTHQAGLSYLDRQLSREEVLDGSRIVEASSGRRPHSRPAAHTGTTP